MSLSEVPGLIAVIDVETTGLFPFRQDRVVEVAAVVIQADGRVQREFVSLVNPARDIGRSSIHGLTSEDILHAPQFSEIAPLLVEAVTGSVAIAAHNVRFDQQFLESEFSRMGHPLPGCVSICTMQLAGGGRLTECCTDYGIALTQEPHHAIADARAAARLLSVLLTDAPRMTQKLTKLVPIQWPTVSRTGKPPITRDESRHRQSQPRTYLHRLLGRMHDSAVPGTSDGSVMAYEALLDRVLEDRHVDDREAEALIETAAKWGLSSGQIQLAHREYLNRLAIAAVTDGVVTDTERRDLELVARLLGQGSQDVDEILRQAVAKLGETRPCAVPAPIVEQSLLGKRVCFTGELQCKHEGQTISRELAEELATKAGLLIMDSVSKKLDLLVVADPHTQSGKAKRARQYGIRIMHEPVFWKTISVKVE